jgi:signal transduction histidine kinase
MTNKMQPPIQENNARVDRRLSDQTVRLPFALADRLLVLVRWVIVIASGAMSRFDGFGGSTFALPTAVWLAAIAYNLPISFYIWRRQPLMNRRGKWLLWADLAQAMLTVALTGGYRSFYFVLFLLAMTELALAYPWRFALIAIFGISVLEVGAMTFGEFPGGEPFATYLVVGKFILSLLVGGLVTIFGELMRREEAARQAAERTATQVTTLNAVSMQLGKSILSIESTLATILRDTRLLPDTIFSLVLLPDATQSAWLVAACDSMRDCVGECVEGLTAEQLAQPFFISRAPGLLLPFAGADGLGQVVGMTLHAPEGEVMGVLIVGWQSQGTLSEDERAFLLSLAQIAGMALRNARLYAQEQEHVARLKRFEQHQSTFFSAIGHELKTPLTVLKMLVPSLSQWTNLPANTQTEIVETFSQNLDRLETLIADWLESARLEAGAVKLHRQPVDLVRLSQHVIDELSPLLARKQQKSALHASANLPAIQGDHRQLKQVLLNLVGNAVKFAPPNSEIGVQLQRSGDSIQVCVEDAGPGVPLSERERIFDKFYTTVENQALAGAGLGLFVCRELVQLHGGSIWVQDRPGGGSRVCFTLPCGSEENPNGEGD